MFKCYSYKLLTNVKNICQNADNLSAGISFDTY